MQGAPATGTGGASGDRAVGDRLARHGDSLTVAELHAAAHITAYVPGVDGDFMAGLLLDAGTA